jgi:two-component system CheB/CheR fusion protein
MTPASPPLHIFVVENHEDTLKYLRMYLETLGHTVASATSMADALQKIPGQKVDLLLSDIGLPDGSGWELLEQLPSASGLFAVANIGEGINADRARSRAAGYRHHLIKPFMPDELDSILAEASALRTPAAGAA